MNNVWSQRGSSFIPEEITHQVQKLPVGIYKVQEHPALKFLYLDRVQDSFPFPYKVYGIERPFIDRVKKSYENTTGNFGVLLNGMKGTGKTVTAEIICNEMNLPVIIIPRHYDSIVSFLNNIQQDVIVFIDEFEKIYDRYQNSLLTIMDGAMKTKHRIFFLLTTNETRIDSNLLQRPSRIRYVKMFSDMKLEVIMEVVDDLLKHKHHRESAIKMISEMPIITMDLVKAVINEINIHDEDPYEFREIFNVHADRSELYNIFEIKDGERLEIKTFATISPSWLSEYSVGEDFEINGRPIGYIKSVLSSRQLLVAEREDEDDASTEVARLILLEPAVKTHKAFAGSSLAF